MANLAGLSGQANDVYRRLWAHWERELQSWATNGTDTEPPLYEVDPLSAAETIEPEGTQYRAEVSAFEIELLCRHWATEMRLTDIVWLPSGQNDHSLMLRKITAVDRWCYFQNILGIDRLGHILRDVYRDVD